MKPIIFATMIMLSTVAFAQRTNIDRLPEKERNEYLLKTAKEIVMKHAPEWYRDKRQPLIRSLTPDRGPDKGRLRYAVTYYNDPGEKSLRGGFSVAVGIYADTGEAMGISFGDGTGYIFPPKSETRGAEKPFYRSYPKTHESPSSGVFD